MSFTLVGPGDSVFLERIAPSKYRRIYLAIICVQLFFGVAAVIYASGITFSYVKYKNLYSGPSYIRCKENSFTHSMCEVKCGNITFHEKCDYEYIYDQKNNILIAENMTHQLVNVVFFCLFLIPFFSGIGILSMTVARIL